MTSGVDLPVRRRRMTQTRRRRNSTRVPSSCLIRGSLVSSKWRGRRSPVTTLRSERPQPEQRRSFPRSRQTGSGVADGPCGSPSSVRAWIPQEGVNRRPLLSMKRQQGRVGRGLRRKYPSHQEARQSYRASCAKERSVSPGRSFVPLHAHVECLASSRVDRTRRTRHVAQLARA